MPDSANGEQIRIVAEQVADTAITRFAAQHPEVRRGTVVSEIPAPMKWAGGIVAALLTAGTATLAFWLFTSVSQMSVTLARMDERMANYTDAQTRRMDELEGRVSELESYHREGAR